MIKILYAIITSFLFASCSLLMVDSAKYTSGEISRVVIYVDKDLEGLIDNELNIYRSDLLINEIDSEIRYWDGTPSELRDNIRNIEDLERMNLALFFIGDIPAAWYELVSFGEYEKFPTDIYYASPQTNWEDRDNNGIFDSHSFPTIIAPVSRITGNADEINGYFQKLHNHRNINFGDGTAVIFKDDDWSSFQPDSYYGLNSIFSSAEKHVVPASTFKNDYNRILSSGTATYVYQWIHANPEGLYIDENGIYNIFRRNDITPATIDANFINMFNCKGARFTSSNLGMTYIIESESTLAVTGSSKVGGNFVPDEFHRSLAAGCSWSKSFREWYNSTGSYDDKWYLGMVIFGDPTLKIEKSSSKVRRNLEITNLIYPNSEHSDQIYQELIDFEYSN